MSRDNPDGDFIGMCVYGDSDPPTFASFDGQFEGLAIRPEDRSLRVIAFHAGYNSLTCNYEARFDDIRPHEAHVEKLYEDNVPE